MLQYTFCGLGNLSYEAEEWLWKNGILCWNDYVTSNRHWFSKQKHLLVLADILEAQNMLRNGTDKWKWFCRKLPASCRVRLYPHIRQKCLYLDIETTGLLETDKITIIGISNEMEKYTFVRGQNLLDSYRFLSHNYIFVTHNGRLFDIPFIRRELQIPMRQLNIDLRTLLRAQGLPQSQKKAEKSLGIIRLHAPDVPSGKEAVALWNAWTAGDSLSLKKLIKYNFDDLAGLVEIFKRLYNISMAKHPFLR